MKVVLSIAGSDSSGGAGIQADLKTFEYFGVFGCSVVTVLTAQNTMGVKDIYSIDPQFLKKQLDCIFEDFDVSAIKIGMLFSNEIIDIVKEYVKNLQIPIVFDPVFISKAGSTLLNDDAIENLKSMIQYATIITPNQFEAKKLFGDKYSDDDLLSFPCAVVVKNIIQENISKDVLYKADSKVSFESAYIQSENTHGTGCSFSSAIAANLALGKSLEESVKISKEYIYQGILHAPNIGNGKGPIKHNLRTEND